ncbi:MAG TPA: hypothetical protein VIZ18_05145 [Ktedonobacteraceae bacterium]
MPFDAAIEGIAALLSPLPVTWGFCGGWAIDLFLNRITRSHKDVDVTVMRADQRIVFDYLRQRGWILEKAVDGSLIPLMENELLVLPIHTVWCRNDHFQPDFLEILLNEYEGNHFVFRRNRLIQYPLNNAFLISPPGFPILAPEIALLYKSNNHQDAENRQDFQSALPALNSERKQWLAQALFTLSPEHEWLNHLNR